MSKEKKNHKIWPLKVYSNLNKSMSDFFDILIGCLDIHIKKCSTVEPRLSGLVGTSVKSPDNRESG